MSLIQKLAIAYAIMFFAVVGIGYVPAFNDANGYLFGLFSLQWYDDLLHAFSGVWALAAALISTSQSVLTGCSAITCSTACLASSRFRLP